MREIYITGFSELKKLIETLNNNSNIEDYTYECESRGECDDTHEYYIQVIHKEIQSNTPQCKISTKQNIYFSQTKYKVKWIITM